MSPRDQNKRPFRLALSQLLQVGNPALTGDVLKLAFRKCSLTERLVGNFHAMKLLADDSLVTAHHDIEELAARLRTYDTTSSVWISTEDEQVMSGVITAVRSMTKMCAVTKSGKLHPHQLRQEILRLGKVHQTILNILIAVDEANLDV